MCRVSIALLISLCAFASAAGQIPSGPGDWPQWRGPNRDGHSGDSNLVRDWPKDGPPVLWQIDTIGVGYSSLAVKEGRIFTQGDLHGVEHVICLDAKSGKTLWAVQPEPVKAQLAQRVAEEVKRLDANSDGTIDELEALNRFGFNFNNFDRAGEGDAAEIAATRTKRLFAAIDKNGDGQLTADEVGRPFYDEFERIDRPAEGADAPKVAAERAAAWLAQRDTDSDKTISREEARQSIVDHYFGRMDERDPATNKGDEKLTAEEISKYFTQREAGKDGTISTAEMQTYYASRWPGRDGLLTADDVKGYYGGLRDGQGDGPRGTPTVDGDRVYVEGGMGDVTCLDAATGKTIWHVNLVRDFGGSRPGWGYSESPLVEDKMLLVTPGGKEGTLLALDKYTGEKLWRSGGIGEGAHYSSPVAADIHGVRTIVQFASKNCFGVDARDGRLLWTYSGANNGTANCTTPIVDDNSVFASSAYGTGGGLAKILPDGDGQRAEEVYFDKQMANHHGGIVKVGDYIYGFGNAGLMCLEFKTGELKWKARSAGKGSLCFADGMLYLLGEGHQVALAEATPEEYREHGSFKIESHGRPSWAHPIVAGGVFYIRDQHTLTAYDVRK
jgi:outer membrane protein assembly factor BamB